MVERYYKNSTKGKEILKEGIMVEAHLEPYGLATIDLKIVNQKGELVMQDTNGDILRFDDDNFCFCEVIK